MIEDGSFGAKAFWKRPEHGKRDIKFEEIYLYEVRSERKFRGLFLYSALLFFNTYNFNDLDRVTSFLPFTYSSL